MIAALTPEKPTNLLKVSADTTQITFSWTAAVDNGSPLTDHKVYWNAGSGSTFSLLEEDLGVISQYSTAPTTADLTDGAIYRFKVVALNAVGPGTVSDSVSIIAATVPDAPAAPTLLSQSSTSISI